MKAGIAKCLEELVRKTYGDANGTASLVEAGQPAGRLCMTTAGIPDGEILALIGATAKVWKITGEAAMDAFGMYWSATYATSIYTLYYDQWTNARDFLRDVDHVHAAITSRVPNATPPHFTFDASDPKKLVIVYETKRGLVALMPGLVKGVAAYYKQKVRVSVSGCTVTTFLR